MGAMLLGSMILFSPGLGAARGSSIVVPSGSVVAGGVLMGVDGGGSGVVMVASCFFFHSCNFFGRIVARNFFIALAFFMSSTFLARIGFTLNSMFNFACMRQTS